MITLIGECPDIFTYEITIATSRPFLVLWLLGSNERKYPWMDEGLANYCETRSVKNNYAQDDTIQDDQLGYLGFSTCFTFEKIQSQAGPGISLPLGASLNMTRHPILTPGTIRC
jgi:hypothetical protein